MPPITSIPVNDRREVFTATGGQTVFTFDFPVYAAADIAATRLRGGVLTNLTNGLDFTVSGAADQAGGSITLTAGALAGDVITIISNQPINRVTAFPPSGELSAEALNVELNKRTIADQQLLALISGGLRVPAADGILSELPPAAARAGFLLGFDPITGAPILVAPSSVVAGSTTGPYDLSFDFGGSSIAPGDRRIISIVRTLTFPANFATSQAARGTLPTANAVFRIFAGAAGIDAQIGTMTLTPAGATVFASTGGLPITVNPATQNYIFVDPPNPADATLAAVTMTLAGSA